MGRSLLWLATLVTSLVAAAEPRQAAIDRSEWSRAKAARPGATMTFSALPLNATRTGPVRMKRIDVYAPGARVLVPEGDGYREIPRSTWSAWVADKAVAGAPRIALTISPAGDAAQGTLFADDGGTYAVTSAVSESRLLLEVRPAGRSGSAPFVCANDSAGRIMAVPDWRRDFHVEKHSTANVKLASRAATVAIDTDNELMSSKFGDNTTNATNYLVALFAGLNVVYERDLDLTLTQGTTILRVSTVPDPYASAIGSGTLLQLDEFGEEWAANQAAVPRAFAAQLSGKSPDPNFSEGIAWLLEGFNYCNAKGQTFGGCDGQCTFGHYSVSRVFKGMGDPAAQDVGLVGHELGHNFGLAHTHCSSATTGDGNPSVSTGTIDQCVNNESGCFSGTTSCPAPTTVNGVANVRGTLMGYCDVFISGLPGCTTSEVFATVQRNFLMPNIASNVSQGCFVPTSAPNQPPINTVPATIAVTEDSASPLTGIMFTDPDAGTGMVLATFSVPSGALNATSGGGVTVGGTSASRTMTGTIANINTRIASGNLTFTTALNATATVVMTVTLNDQGNTGSGGAMTDTDTTNLTVTAVNDGPTITVANELAINPTGSRALSGLATLGDVDAAAGSMTLTLSVSDGTLTSAAGGGVTVSGSGTATLTLAGTLANLNTRIAAANVTFNQDGSPSTTVNLTQTINDNGNTGSGGALMASGVTTLTANTIFADGFE